MEKYLWTINFRNITLQQIFAIKETWILKSGKALIYMNHKVEILRINKVRRMKEETALTEELDWIERF